MHVILVSVIALIAQIVSSNLTEATEESVPKPVPVNVTTVPPS